MQTAPRSRWKKTLTYVLVLAGGIATGGIACNENKAAPPQTAELRPQPVAKLPTNAPIGSVPALPAPTVAPTAAPVASPAQPAPVTKAPAAPVVQEALPNIPVDAQWTIYCFAVTGPGHMQGANQAKAGLVAKTGRADWYVIHGQNESNLYFGFYKGVLPGDTKNAEDVKRADADMRMVKNIQDREGRRPFANNSAFVSLESPDPTSPQEWNLSNVDRALDPKDPKRAYWSLQIAAFRGDAKRKEAATEMVRHLRTALGIEAYYYHGESISSVCVGKWPPNAVKAQNHTTDRPDLAHSPSDMNLAVTNIPFSKLDPKNPQSVKARPIDNKPTAAIAPEIEILDPTLRAAMADERFRYHAVNYEVGKRLEDGKEALNPSFLVVIPRANGNGLYDSDPPNTRNVAGRNAPLDNRILAPSGPRLVGSNESRR